MNLPQRLFAAFILMAMVCARVVASEPATAVATITAGFVTAITVTSRGSGYTSEPAVTLSGGGGSGATAKAILSGDKVALTLVPTAGSGYTSAPAVVVQAPPKALGVRLELVPKLTELVPKLTVEGPAGSNARVESAASLSGPWTIWTNLTIGAEGTVLVDLSPGSAARFYRAVAEQRAGFVWINPGTFVMGDHGESDEVQRTVRLTQGFWLSDHETTQAEYMAVMYMEVRGINPSNWRGLNLPVEQVSWDDAVSYCKKLTELERAAGRITAQQAYRLPTEAEWEYAAQPGTTGARYGALDLIAWWEYNSGKHTNPVKQKAANAWGLYDMVGNVWEWCSDWYGGYPTESVTDPTGPSSGRYRVIRGGSWGDGSWGARSAARGVSNPGNRGSHLGFRPALSSVR